LKLDAKRKLTTSAVVQKGKNWKMYCTTQLTLNIKKSSIFLTTRLSPLQIIPKKESFLLKYNS